MHQSYAVLSLEPDNPGSGLVKNVTDLVSFSQVPKIEQRAQRITHTGLTNPAGMASAAERREPLADGSAEQVPDAIGESQSKCPADNDSQHGAADVAAADAGAERAGQAQGDEHGDGSDWDP